MKTTELYAEQVLIGIIVILVFALPWLPEIRALAKDWQTADTFAAGTMVIGAAFLLGIVADRFADTLTEPLETHQRLRFMWQRLIEAREPDQKVPDANEQRTFLDRLYGDKKNDPFPEDSLYLRALTRSNPIVDWVHYHRSRIRLTRAMLVYVPALTISSIVGMGRVSIPSGCCEACAYIGLVTILFYGGIAWGNANWRKCAPRTDDKHGAIEYACQNLAWSRSARVRDLKFVSILYVLGRDFLVTGSALLLLVGVVGGALVTVRTGSGILLMVGLPGLVVAGMSGWSWWRIGKTFRSFLVSVDEKIKSKEDDRSG